MVDFIKLYWRDKTLIEDFVTKPENFSNLYSVLEEHTGEIAYPKRSYIENMLVVMSENSAYVKNSIHKLHNKVTTMEEHNHNDLTYMDLCITIDFLASKLIDLDSATINQLEFGFNISTNIPAETIINEMVLMHNYKGFNRDINFKGKGKLKQFERSGYVIKVYDKAKQYGLQDNILRFEIKLFSRRLLKDLGVNQLKDLKNKVVLEKLFNLTIKRFDEMIIIDNTPTTIEIPKQEKEILIQYKNPHYWQTDLRGQHSQKVAREKKKHIRLLQKHGLLTTKKELRMALLTKQEYLMKN